MQICPKILLRLEEVLKVCFYANFHVHKVRQSKQELHELILAKIELTPD